MTLILASEFPASVSKTINLLGDGMNGKKAVFIPTAAYGENFEPKPEDYIKPFEAIGMTVSSFDLQGKNEQEVESALTDASVISVCGGNTFFLLEHMKKCGFKAVIQKCLDAGAIYIGSSAGSIVCSPDIDFIDVMDDPARASLDNTKGLGLIDFLFLPHLDHPTLKEKALLRISNYEGDTPMVALRDEQLLCVMDKVVRVY